MKKPFHAVSKLEATLFWFIFAALIGSHLWIGGMVLDAARIDGQYAVRLRGRSDTWQSVSAVPYYFHIITRYAAQGLVLIYVVKFAFRRLTRNKSKGDA